MGTITDNGIKGVAVRLSKLLDEEQGDGLKVVISNYEHKKFASFIVGPPELKELLLNINQASSSNRLLIFHSRLSTIVNARVVNVKGDLHKEMNNCMNDLKSFRCTFKSFINQGVILIGVLVCPSLSREVVENEMEFYFDRTTRGLMRYFFLTKNQLQQSDALSKWWKKIFKRERNGKFEVSLIFQRIAGQCMTTIACCGAVNKSMCPVVPIFLSPDKRMRILTMLLTASQLDAINGPEKQKVICGPYGSGKTIVAESVVRSIYEKSLLLNRNCLIIYAIPGYHSLLEVRNRRFVRELEAENRKSGMYCNYY